MKRVSHTTFNTRTRPIGRDVEMTLALVGALGQAAGIKTTRFHGLLKLIKAIMS